ncbi:ABC transporter ATP-binding protein [Tepidibacillus marianensis]|uniref:ABC transporter ATP-binding protein n=1 Tax=Tepidibacillus marianensis TaxID=3131995 RepID=UPI0030CADF24
MTTNKLELQQIFKEYPMQDGRFQTLDNISIHVKEGEFVSIIGPSGSGKSTLFNLISGLEPPTQGEILLDGTSIKNKKGYVSYMPQKDHLLPWRTVLDNLILGMEIKGISKTEARKRAKEYLEVFGLETFDNEYPSSLSGGMRQRAALLRTILLNNNVLLLDEPFGALDEITRMNMQQWLLAIWGQFHHTILFVTHSIDEAVFLSDRVYVLSPRPAHVQGIVEINLPRPRGTEIITGERFSLFKKDLLVLLGQN